MSYDKLNTLYLHLQETHGQQTKQDADLQWVAAIVKAKWPFDYVNNVRSRDDLIKKLCFHYHKTYGH